jgi:hypothetical protein
MNIQRVGNHDRGTVSASNTYGRSIQVDAGSGRRILLGMNSGRFTPDNLTVPVRDGQAFSLLGDSTTAYGEREVIWELRNPNVGTFNFVTNTIDTTNINDGTWWWMVLDDTNGSAGVATVLGSGGAVSLTPAATVGATDLAFCIGSSAAYSGGGALSGSGAANISAPIAGRSGVYAVGSVPGIGPWPSNQCAAITVVVQSAVAAPVLTGNITADDAAPTGTLSSTAPSTLTGNIAADDAAPTGNLGAAAGTINIGPWKSDVGMPLPSTTIPKITFLRDSDGVQVLTLLNQVTSSSPTAPMIAVTNGALVAGQKYWVASWNVAGSAYGLEPYTAA